jgi:hypothetical protein
MTVGNATNRSITWIWLPLVCLAACAVTERDGNFSYRRHTRSFGGHRSGWTELWYRGKVITPRVSGWRVDPRNPDRIVYATEVNTANGCGTFFLDAKSGATSKILPRNTVVHPPNDDVPGHDTEPWSPDGRYVVVGNDISRASVFDITRSRVIDFTEVVSRDGRRLEMNAYAWSPDSRRLVVIVAADGYHGDYDLTAMTIDPPAVEYVATMSGDLPLWTTADYRWEGSTLIASTLAKHGSSFRKRPEELEWIASPPREARPESATACR